jgi:hypothetical protein
MGNMISGTTGFKHLTISQKLSVFSLILLSISLPFGILFALKPIRPIISPASGPVEATKTPTPAVTGNPPTIITQLLPTVQSGKPYRARLEGYDIDRTDYLSISVNNIPEGLVVANCKQNERNIKTADYKVKYISCDLTGRTTEVGEFQTMGILSDGVNKTVKYFRLEIFNQ